jgi:DNA-damage-inducible protein J
MSANAVVRARIDEHIKEEATAVLAAMGLTVSDAFRIMLTRVAREKPCRSSRWCQTPPPSRR